MKSHSFLMFEFIFTTYKSLFHPTQFFEQDQTNMIHYKNSNNNVLYNTQINRYLEYNIYKKLLRKKIVLEQRIEIGFKSTNGIIHCKLNS